MLQTFSRNTLGGPMDHPTPTPEQMRSGAAFRRLLEHLDSHRDVQNIDLMNLSLPELS